MFQSIHIKSFQRQRTVREKILRRLFGSPVRIVVIVPCETVCAVGITEMQERKRGEALAAQTESCGADLDPDAPDYAETREHTMTTRRKRRSETHEKSMKDLKRKQAVLIIRSSSPAPTSRRSGAFIWKARSRISPSFSVWGSRKARTRPVYSLGKAEVL